MSVDESIEGTAQVSTSRCLPHVSPGKSCPGLYNSRLLLLFCKNDVYHLEIIQHEICTVSAAAPCEGASVDLDFPQMPCSCWLWGLDLHSNHTTVLYPVMLSAFPGGPWLQHQVTRGCSMTNRSTRICCYFSAIMF